MGMNDRISGKGYRNGRGSNLSTRKRLFADNGPKTRLDLERCCDSMALSDAICAALSHGALISFSTTRDGTAISLTILDGDTREQTYCTTAEEFTDALTAVAEYWEPTPPMIVPVDLPLPSTDSTPPAKRPRKP